jgi:hypothetical protein
VVYRAHYYERLAVTIQQGYLLFDNIDMEQADISSRCSRCGQKFSADPKPGERVDEVLLRIRADFEAHQCCV